MTSITGKFAAIVLAGDRGPDDPVARAAGVSCKALVPVAGRTMILRVLDALIGSSVIDSLIVCGSSSRLAGHSAELDGLIAAGKIRWVEKQIIAEPEHPGCLERSAR